MVLINKKSGMGVGKDVKPATSLTYKGEGIGLKIEWQFFYMIYADRLNSLQYSLGFNYWIEGREVIIIYKWETW